MKNFYPKRLHQQKLERYLQAIPQVADVVIVLYPDEEAGEIPMAFIMRKPGKVRPTPSRFSQRFSHTHSHIVVSSHIHIKIRVSHFAIREMGESVEKDLDVKTSAAVNDDCLYEGNQLVIALMASFTLTDDRSSGQEIYECSCRY